MARLAIGRSSVSDARVQPILPLVKQPKPLLCRAASLIGEIVGCAGKRVERRHVRTHVRRQQPRSDRKIFVVRPRQPLAFGVRRAQRGVPGPALMSTYRQERYSSGRSCATS
jgi:hypothetical protein